MILGPLEKRASDAADPRAGDPVPLPPCVTGDNDIMWGHPCFCACFLDPCILPAGDVDHGKGL